MAKDMFKFGARPFAVQGWDFRDCKEAEALEGYVGMAFHLVDPEFNLKPGDMMPDEVYEDSIKMEPVLGLFFKDEAAVDRLMLLLEGVKAQFKESPK